MYNIQHICSELHTCQGLVCMCLCVYVHIDTHTRTHAHTRTHTHTHIHTHSHTYTHTHTHKKQTHAQTHTHTQTQTQKHTGVETLQQVCAELNTCNGFNSNGWLKTRVAPANQRRLQQGTSLWIKRPILKFPIALAALPSFSGVCVCVAVAVAVAVAVVLSLSLSLSGSESNNARYSAVIFRCAYANVYVCASECK